MVYEIYTTCFDQSDHSICNNYDLSCFKQLNRSAHAGEEGDSIFPKGYHYRDTVLPELKFNTQACPDLLLIPSY